MLAESDLPEHDGPRERLVECLEQAAALHAQLMAQRVGMAMHMQDALMEAEFLDFLCGFVAEDLAPGILDQGQVVRRLVLVALGQLPEDIVDGLQIGARHELRAGGLNPKLWLLHLQ